VQPTTDVDKKKCFWDTNNGRWRCRANKKTTTEVVAEGVTKSSPDATDDASFAVGGGTDYHSHLGRHHYYQRQAEEYERAARLKLEKVEQFEKEVKRKQAAVEEWEKQIRWTEDFLRQQDELLKGRYEALEKQQVELQQREQAYKAKLDDQLDMIQYRSTILQQQEIVMDRNRREIEFQHAELQELDDTIESKLTEHDEELKSKQAKSGEFTATAAHVVILGLVLALMFALDVISRLNRCCTSQANELQREFDAKRKCQPLASVPPKARELEVKAYCWLLGLNYDQLCKVTMYDVEKAYRRSKELHHPCLGGHPALYAQLDIAKECVMAEVPSHNLFGAWAKPQSLPTMTTASRLASSLSGLALSLFSVASSLLSMAFSLFCVATLLFYSLRLALSALSVHHESSSAEPEKKKKGTSSKYKPGQKVFYNSTGYIEVMAKVVSVHLDDYLVPYYTILVQGREKQTDDAHLSPVQNDDAPELRYRTMRTFQ
jgi:hypothetical protein